MGLIKNSTYSKEVYPLNLSTPLDPESDEFVIFVSVCSWGNMKCKENTTKENCRNITLFTLVVDPWKEIFAV